MPQNPAEEPWAPPVHNIQADRADLPLYNRLYAATEQLAKSRVQDSLHALTARSVAEDVAHSLHALHQFMSQGPECQAPAERRALEALDPAAMQALRDSLAAHLEKTPQALSQESVAAERRVAEQMAAELARSMWSTLLDHAERHAVNGMVAPERLLPGYPDGGVTSPLQDKLREDLRHFSLPLEVLVELSHATLDKVARAEAGADIVRLPQRLKLSKAALRSFLDAQTRLRSRRSPATRTDDFPARGTLPISAL